MNAPLLHKCQLRTLNFRQATPHLPLKHRQNFKSENIDFPTILTHVSVEANRVDPDQAAPTGDLGLESSGDKGKMNVYLKVLK